MFDLSTLNPRQREAVLHTEGPLLVLAGAGSGKTRVITFRIAHLLTTKKVPAANILAVSFTNKAADEMRQRLRGQVSGGVARGLTVSTFHSLSARILREDIDRLGYRKNFTILDANEQEGVLKQVLREIKFDDRKFKAEWIAANISRAKNAFIEPLALKIEHGDDYEIMTAAAYGKYQEALRALNALDFDDLMLLAVKLLATDTATRDKYRERFRYILIDEYQDTNACQYRFVMLLAGGHKNLCVVGDDDQSIYGWRGGEVGNILNFERDFDHTKIVTLDQNYRSTQRILAVANSVIKHNRDRRPKRLWSDGGLGEPVTLIECEDEAAEARTIAERILALKLSCQAKFEEFGVLYRTNQQSRPIEEAFRLQNIPYELIGGLKFYDRKEVKDLLCYLRVLLNPGDEVALLRILNYPARGIGRTSAIRLGEYARDRGQELETVLRDADRLMDIPPKAREGIAALIDLIDRHRQAAATDRPATVAQAVLDETDMRAAIRAEDLDPERAARRIENVEEVIAGITAFQDAQPEARLEHYLDRICLMAAHEREGETGPGVRLMTIHSAKGLEFPYVLLPGLEEDTLPHKRSTEAADTLAEERRLFYVALTRARRRLVLTYARSRHRYNKDVPRHPSRFLAEIPEDQIERERLGAAAPVSPETEDRMAQEFFTNMRRLLD